MRWSARSHKTRFGRGDVSEIAMAYMMSKSAYLTDEGDHNEPHLTFFTPIKDGKDWGAGAVGSPVVVGAYWFFSPKEIPNERAATDSCVRSRGYMVRRNACGQA